MNKMSREDFSRVFTRFACNYGYVPKRANTVETGTLWYDSLSQKWDLKTITAAFAALIEEDEQGERKSRVSLPQLVRVRSACYRIIEGTREDTSPKNACGACHGKGIVSLHPTTDRMWATTDSFIETLRTKRPGIMRKTMGFACSCPHGRPWVEGIEHEGTVIPPLKVYGSHLLDPRFIDEQIERVVNDHTEGPSPVGTGTGVQEALLDS